MFGKFVALSYVKSWNKESTIHLETVIRNKWSQGKISKWNKLFGNHPNGLKTKFMPIIISSRKQFYIPYIFVQLEDHMIHNKLFSILIVKYSSWHLQMYIFRSIYFSQLIKGYNYPENNVYAKSCLESSYSYRVVYEDRHSVISSQECFFFLISEPKLQYMFMQMDLYISGACSHLPLYMGSFFSITHPFHYSIIFQESWLYLWISTLTYYHVLA